MKTKTLKKTFFFAFTLLCASFFTVCSNALTEPATGAQRSARTQTLSEMTEQECMEFIVSNGITIPPMYANETEFGGGTEDNPYLVTTAEQLQKIPKVDLLHTTIYFKLAQNIDLQGIYWEPIPSFTGYFDGDDKTISNLHVNTNYNEEPIYAGLFGVNYGTIENLTINGSIYADDPSVSAGFVAAVNQGTIYNVQVSGEINVNQGEYIGMIAGCNSGTIDSCVVSSNEN